MSTVEEKTQEQKDAEYFATSKVKISENVKSKRVRENLQEIKNQLILLGQEYFTQVDYLKVKDWNQNRHIYTLKISQPVEYKVYSDESNWKQSGQSMDILGNYIASIEKITGAKFKGTRITLTKVESKSYNKNEMTLEASFEKIQRKNVN